MSGFEPMTGTRSTSKYRGRRRWAAAAAALLGLTGGAFGIASAASPTPAPGSPRGAAGSPVAPGASTVVCDGDGVQGARVQLLYAHGPGKGQDAYDATKSLLKKLAAEVDAIYDKSAAETDGVRHVRYVTEPDCTASVLSVELPEAVLKDPDPAGTRTALARAKFDSTDRKYLIFVDDRMTAEGKKICGTATMEDDDQPGQDNQNNVGPSYAKAVISCGAHTAAHELAHMLGAVQNSAPNASGGGHHCTDEWDVMCYKDFFSDAETRTVCGEKGHDDRLDCNHDDYYNTRPEADSYLATHWNIANSRFLISPDPGPTPAVPSPGTTGGPTGGPGSCTASPWDQDTTYVLGDLVSYNGTYWRAKWWSRATPPGTPPAYGPWEQSGTCNG